MASYTLYGNTQSNNFECKDDRECVMYGYWNTDANGKNLNNKGDTFILDFSSRNYTIEDFKKMEDPDIIIIAGTKTPWTDKDKNGYPALNISHKNKFGKIIDLKTITFRDVTFGEVGGWVTKAKNEDGLLNDANLKKLPIYIQK